MHKTTHTQGIEGVVCAVRARRCVVGGFVVGWRVPRAGGQGAGGGTVCGHTPMDQHKPPLLVGGFPPLGTA